jgi:uncharacterized protein YecT (DUF1311 family)
VGELMKACSACLALLVLAPSLVAQPVPHDQTQASMNDEAAKLLGDAEKELARVLDELEQRGRGREAALVKLRSGELAWEKYRDAQLQALWPSPDSTAYGSVHSMCVVDAKRMLTEARTRELRAMISPVEGDVCGSLWPE